MKETRKLPVTLTEAELTERRDALAARDQERVKIEIEKKAASRGFRERLKPVVEDITRISSEIISRTEVRDVECEVRDSLVNGQVEVVRLDTFEVIDTYMPGASVDDDEPDPNQPVLPFAAPAGSPSLRCTAIDVDGVVYAITPRAGRRRWIARSSRREVPTLIIDGTHRHHRRREARQGVRHVRDRRAAPPPRVRGDEGGRRARFGNSADARRRSRRALGTVERVPRSTIAGDERRHLRPQRHRRRGRAHRRHDAPERRAAHAGGGGHEAAREGHAEAEEGRGE
jgi:hypothetical protein